MADFSITQFDTSPALVVRMVDSRGVAFAPAGGSSAAFKAVRRPDGHVIAGVASISTDTLTWTPVVGDTALPGCFDVQFTVTLPGGGIVSFPTCSGPGSLPGFTMEICQKL